MFYRKDAVLMAVAGLLASSGFAMGADTFVVPKVGVDPTTVVTAQSMSDVPQTLQGWLDRAGVGKTLSDYGVQVYGWVESGYTYNHRHSSGDTLIIPGPFNHEFGNHYMLNQLTFRIERLPDTKKFDVGGMVEVMYGSDAARIHPRGGFGFDGSDLSDDNNPTDDLAVANLHPIWQFDVPQAYVNINLPVGANGLQIKVGKFVTLLGYETIDPTQNLFYSHSYLFSAIPFTQVGVLGTYKINDNWQVTAGFTRGWDIATEDNNGCAIDFLGNVVYYGNNWNATVNLSIGPQNEADSGHYRVAINPIVKFKVTEQLNMGVEGLYVFDGGINGSPGDTHHYGDVWGVAIYASYKINDMFTINARAEKAHSYLGSFGGIDVGTLPSSGVPTINAYEFTLGTTITPFPRELKGLMIRPEVRYDWSEDSIYPAQGRAFQDQLTFGADVIFRF